MHGRQRLSIGRLSFDNLLSVWQAVSRNSRGAIAKRADVDAKVGPYTSFASTTSLPFASATRSLLRRWGGARAPARRAPAAGYVLASDDSVRLAQDEVEAADAA